MKTAKKYFNILISKKANGIRIKESTNPSSYFMTGYILYLVGASGRIMSYYKCNDIVAKEQLGLLLGDSNNLDLFIKLNEAGNIVASSKLIKEKRVSFKSKLKLKAKNIGASLKCIIKK